MDIGDKIRRHRIKLSLTLDELASRTELSKGFLSQLERNLTSPSIATLTDILEALGTNISDFFKESPQEKVVFSAEDMFEKEDAEHGFLIRWLVPNAQKNELEPILVSLTQGGRSDRHDPHEGEEFGYILSGTVTLYLGTQKFRVKRGECFNFKPTSEHYVANTGKSEAKLIWVSTPPSF
ncbi:MAG: XRE family transcriptional regulator [Clostridia bacterium]